MYGEDLTYTFSFSNPAVANKPGSKAFDQSVFLTPEEQADTQKLLDMGIKIYSQQTPTFKVVPIDHI